MTTRSTGMDWKALEEKPDDWEMMQALIGSGATIVEKMGRGSKNKKASEEDALSLLRESGYLFDMVSLAAYIASKWKGIPSYHKTWVYLTVTKASSWVPVAGGGGGGGGSTDMSSTAGGNKGKKKAPVLSKADQIRMKNSQRLVEKDMEEIRFDTTSGLPVRVQFRYEVTTLVMLMEWWMRSLTLPRDADWVQCLVASERILMHIEKTLGVERCDACPAHALARQIFEKLYEEQSRDRKILETLFRKPKMMMFSLAEKRTGSVALYAQQREVIEKMTKSIIEDRPLLIGNRMPPGTGKTFMAVPMAQAIRSLGRDKTLIFCCPNPLVTKFVASTTLIGHDLHLWQGKFFGYDEDNEKIFIVRPHKRCFPASWKKIYKDTTNEKYGSVEEQFNYYSDKERTGRVPDVLVCDPTTCLEFLQQDRFRERFVAFVDEVIGSTSTTEIMTKILKVLPEHAVVMSAILPRFEDIPFLVEGFKERHSSLGRPAEAEMIDASGVTIACSTIDPEGHLSLPHHMIDSRDDIPTLLESLEKDPLTRRMYAPQHILAMVDLLDTVGPNASWVKAMRIKEWTHQLPSLGRIQYASILGWWTQVLRGIFDHRDETNWKAVRGYRPMVIPEKHEVLRMFSDQAYMYKSKHLHIYHNDSIYPRYDAMCRAHLAGAPDILELIRKRDQKLVEIQEKSERLADNKKHNKNSEKMDHKEKMQEMSSLQDEYQSAQEIALPTTYVINSNRHYERFHPSKDPEGKVENRHACVVPRECEDAFTPDLLAMMIAGSVLYEEDKMTDYQRRLALRVLPKMNFIVSGKEIVFGTNIDGLTGLTIDQDFSNPANRSVLLQLIGRIGRVGMSYEARVMVESTESLLKIMKTPVYHPQENPDPDVVAMQTAWTNA